ncbi:MAG: zinc-ribbon domain-containing protein [Alphaproteobacteria bacterium]|nr:zinc-ribbon domain-containing protein [Alphaproteobacteria bacterium]MDE2629532.1 zinc-ribbon domain-containing protein [Alphaproteobacteria bacterium]
MILTCPACSTRYQADESKFPPAGRSVRCAKCSHVWHQSAPEPETEAEAAVAAAEPVSPPRTFEAAPRPQAYAPPPSFAAAPPQQAAERTFRMPKGLLLGAGWAGLAAAVVLIVWTAAVYRQEVVAKWPQFASLYSTFGVKVSASGLDIVDLKFHEESEDGQAVLVVTGKLVNISRREMPVPQIRVALTDEDKRELYHWTFVPSVITLRPGQTTPFVTRLSSPPAATRHLDARFAKTGE